MSKSMRFLVNPAGTSKRKRRTRRKATTTRAGKMAAKRKRRRRAGVAVVRANPAKRHARRRRSRGFRAVRRNPPFSVGSVVRDVKEGVVDGAFGVVGFGGVRVIREKLGFTAGTLVGSFVEAAAAVGLAIAARMALGGSVGRAVGQGGFMAPMVSLVKATNVPVLAAALGDDGDMGEFVHGYPSPMLGDVGGYPRALGNYPTRVPYVGQGSPMSAGFGDDEMSDYDTMAGAY